MACRCWDSQAGMGGVKFRGGARADGGRLSELLGECNRTALEFNNAGGLLLDHSSCGFEGSGEVGMAGLPWLSFGSAARWRAVGILVGVELRFDVDVIRAEDE